MSLALRSGDVGDENGFFIYFDAVTAYTQNYSGSVTKHPIDTGASVVDHFIKDNPTITISAVVTGVDVSTGSVNISGSDGERANNAREAPSTVSVAGTDDSFLSSIIPNSIRQFLPQNQPEVILDDFRGSVVEQVKAALRELVIGTETDPATGDEVSKINLVHLYEYNGTFLNRVVYDLVVTNVSFSENADSGDALYCELTLEQVKFVGLRREAIPQEFTESMSAQSAPKESQGKQDSTERDVETANEEKSSRLREAVNSVKSQTARIGGGD